ncbi:MAG: hypothetical protein IJ151_06610 [Bacteroidales bacterium]|nr:hypothetical protein [Bacteroidales bacterium]
MEIFYEGSDPVLKDKTLSIPVEYIHHGFVYDSAIPVIRTLLYGIPYNINGDVFNTILRGEETYLIYWKVKMDVS